MKKRLISPDFFPNFEKDDYEIIRKLLWVKGDKLIQGNSLEILKNELKRFFTQGEIFLFNSERGALQKFLEFYLSKTKNKKVGTQAFTCFVVPKAILNAGGIPVFLDIKKGDVNFDENIIKQTLENHPDLSVLILQNTFGIPNDVVKIIEIAKENNLLVIENLAHSFGAKYKEKYLGNFGDVALVSFGRSKVLSGIFGGALVINNKELADEFSQIYKKIKYPNKFWVRKTLLYAYLMKNIRMNYNKFTKALTSLLRVLKVIEPEISKKEYLGKVDELRLLKMPEAFAKIAVHQLRKLYKFSEHREQISKIYLKEGILPYGFIPTEYEFYFLRYPITVSNPRLLIDNLKKYNIYLGNWYNSPLAPIQKRLDRFGYYYGMCKNAEELCFSICNLPTNILTTKSDAFLITELIKKFA